METSSLSLNSIAVFLLLAFAAIGSAQVSCPATVRVTEQVEAPAGWSPQGGSRQAPFLRASVLNGRPGSKEYDLAPSSTNQGKTGDVSQVWNLSDYRDMNLFLRCHYRNTEAVINKDLPKSLETCTFQFRLDSKGNVIGQGSVTCK